MKNIFWVNTIGAEQESYKFVKLTYNTINYNTETLWWDMSDRVFIYRD